jgi:hypothetical protein
MEVDEANDSGFNDRERACHDTLPRLISVSLDSHYDDAFV